MLRYLIFWVALLGHQSYAGGSFSAPESIPSAMTISPIYTACNTMTGEFMAVWADTHPNFSIYTPGSGWSIPNTITADSSVISGGDVSISCKSASGQFFATWTDSGGEPYFSIYTPGMGWGLSAPIPSAYTSVANTSNAYDPITDRFLVVWIGPMPNQNPIYAFYSSGGWSTAMPIDASYGGYEVFVCVNSSNGQFLATWQDYNNAKPTYSFYTPESGWSLPPAYINAGYATDADVICSCNSVTGQYVATWVTHNAMTQYVPYYSFYTDGEWGVPTTIPLPALTNGDYYVAYDLTTNQLLATWSDGTFLPGGMIPTSIPTYSFYSPAEGWSAPMPISTESLAYVTAFPLFNPHTGMFLVTWSDFFTVTYSFYSHTAPHSFKRPSNRR